MISNRKIGLSEPPADEHSLVELARKNDITAYETLYRLHVKRIYGLCLRFCSDRELAEDLTQEAFVLAWRKLGSFRGDSAFGSWLYRIATNVALSHLRKHKRVMTSLDQDIPEEIVRSDPALSLTLEEGIKRLPTGARAVFVLYSIEGFSHLEISRELRIAVGSSKAQLHRARQLLKNYMKDPVDE